MRSVSVIYGGGYLNRIKLKKVNGYIYGNISVKTSTRNIVSFSVYQPEITSTGKENPSYKSMLKIMEEYKDMTMDEPDFVVVNENYSYPNASISFRDTYYKTLKFITRKKSDTIGFSFKIYGIRFKNSENNLYRFEYLDYNDKIKPIEFVGEKEFDFVVDEIYDLQGWIKEGLYDGIPVDELRIKHFQKSKLEVDFNNAIESTEYKDPF